MNVWAIAGGVIAVLAIACGILFYLYGDAREDKGALQQSNTQLTTTVETKVEAQKQRATVERKNSSADWNTLVDKLR